MTCVFSPPSVNNFSTGHPVSLFNRKMISIFVVVFLTIGEKRENVNGNKRFRGFRFGIFFFLFFDVTRIRVTVETQSVRVAAKIRMKSPENLAIRTIIS